MSKLEVAEKMVGVLLDHARQCDVDLEGVNRHNFNIELDDRFGDGGEARCEHFADIGWEYAGQFGVIGSDAFEDAQSEVLSEALVLLEKVYE